MWLDICQKAFGKIIQSFIIPDVMVYPKYSGNFALDTDAFDSAISAVP